MFIVLIILSPFDLMTLNDLKGLRMSLCMSNKLSEFIWSHLRLLGVMRQQN